ncbi:MAG: hypothetical protein NC433_08145 [Clostridiales bacterium]|nr:hypothetical protein [Clostridiales bacterium]
MTLNRGLKIMGYAHATLFFALMIPIACTVAKFSDPAGAGVLYLKCLLILVPVIVTERAVKYAKNLAIYIAVCIALLAGIWGASALFNESGAYAVCYCLGMSVETVVIALKRMSGRLKESIRRKESDPLAAKEVEFLDTPTLSLMWYFVVVYVLGLFCKSKALCDMAFYSAIVYFFLALVFTYFCKTRSYLEINKRIKGIPTRRLFGVGFVMLLFFSLMIIIGILPSVFLAKHRQYINIENPFEGIELEPEEYPQQMEPRKASPEEKMIMEMLYDEPLPEPSKFLNALFWVVAGICVLVLVYGIIRLIRQAFKDFRDIQDENGDIIEELEIEEKIDREGMRKKGFHRIDSETERIKRRYRKTIRKHRKDRPAPHESPAEIEECAGLKDDEEMHELHKDYEKVRYGE